MIRFPERSGLTPTERFALEVLVDLSRLAPVGAGVTEATRLDLLDGADTGDRASALGPRWPFERRDGLVGIPRAMLRQVVDVAGAAVEQRATGADRYGRVPAQENPLVQVGMERQAVISRAALALRDAVVAVAGRRPVRLFAPWPEGYRWAVAFTHDVDVVEHWPAFAALRWVELARKGELERLLRSVRAALRSVTRRPVERALLDVLSIERAYGITSSWFALCGTPTLKTVLSGDLTYRPEGRAAKRMLEAISRDGHEIGLHGSFETVERHERFATQRARLEALIGGPVFGVRQHYIRLRPGQTQRGMATAGLTYDSSYGFADRNGFRIGVADVVPGWDADRGAPSGLDEVPLHWMDRALSKYQGIENPRAWVDDAERLAQECREVEGLWVGLWHPNLAPALGFPGAPEAFRQVVRRLLAHRPFVAPLHGLVGWRRARRQTLAVGMRADGTLELSGPDPGVHQLFLEDGAGRRVPSTRVG